MNVKNKIRSIFKTKPALIILSALIGVVFISVSFLSDKQTKNDVSDINSYGKDLETRISQLIEKTADGISTDVLITFESSYTKNETAVADVFGRTVGEKYDISEIPAPKVKGVMIVCRGIDNPDDFNVIKKAVATALAIQENQIYIIGGVAQS